MINGDNDPYAKCRKELSFHSSARPRRISSGHAL
jgi:hypothetical protein